MDILYCVNCRKRMFRKDAVIFSGTVLCPKCRSALQNFAADIVTISFPEVPRDDADSAREHFSGRQRSFPMPPLLLDELEAAELLKYNPHNAEALLHMGMREKAKGNLKKAAESFQKILEKSPGDKKAHEHLADIFMGQNDVDAATRELEKLKALEGQNERILFNLGLAYLLGGNEHLGRHQLELALKFGKNEKLKSRISEILKTMA